MSDGKVVYTNDVLFILLFVRRFYRSLSCASGLKDNPVLVPRESILVLVIMAVVL